MKNVHLSTGKGSTRNCNDSLIIFNTYFVLLSQGSKAPAVKPPVQRERPAEKTTSCQFANIIDDLEFMIVDDELQVSIYIQCLNNT